MKIILSLIMILSLLTGCSVNNDELYSKENPVEVTIWTYYTGNQLTTFNNLIKKFNRTVGKDKGIIVDSISQGSINDLQENILAALNNKAGSSNVPEMFLGYSDIAYQVDKLGKAIDLNDYFTEEELDEYVDDYLANGDILGDGRLIVFPIAKSTEVLTINKTDWDIFARATNSSYDSLETIEGLVETAKKYYEWSDSLTATPNDGRAFYGRDAIANYIFTGSKQLGHEIYTVKDGKVSLDFTKEVAYKLWENYYLPYIKGYFASSGRFRSDDVKTGHIICCVGSSSSATFFPSSVTREDDSSYTIEVDALPCPKFKDGKDYVVEQGAGIVVSKSNEAKQSASIEFIKWFTDVKQNTDFSINTGYLPVKKKSVSKDLVSKEMADGTKKIIETAIDEVVEKELFATKAFEKGTSARNYIEEIFTKVARNDREEVKNRLNSGMSLDKAIEPYNNDDYFNKWYQEVYSKLESFID